MQQSPNTFDRISTETVDGRGGGRAGGGSGGRGHRAAVVGQHRWAVEQIYGMKSTVPIEQICAPLAGARIETCYETKKRGSHRPFCPP